MTGPITWEALAYLFALAGTLAGVWWWMSGAVRKVADDLSVYKLEAAEKYASVSHLKEVEGRLASAIERLTNRIDKLLSALEHHQ